MNSSRRHHLIAVFCAPVAIVLAAAAAAQQSPTKIIDVTAKRFSYAPNQIKLKLGEPVVLRFTAVDFTHGFNLPDFNLRADLIEGKQTSVPLTPTEAGRFSFLCDNFCGSGHEQMEGQLIVS